MSETKKWSVEEEIPAGPFLEDPARPGVFVGPAFKSKGDRITLAPEADEATGSPHAKGGQE